MAAVNLARRSGGRVGLAIFGRGGGGCAWFGSGSERMCGSEMSVVPGSDSSICSFLTRDRVVAVSS